MITLLEQKGVPEIVFLRLQDRMLNELADMMLYEKSATNALSSRTSGVTQLKFKELRETGVSMTTEPFFRSLLYAVSRRMIRKIPFVVKPTSILICFAKTNSLLLILNT